MTQTSKMAVFRGYGRNYNKLIGIIALFVTLWWIQVITIGNPYEDTSCSCNHRNNSPGSTGNAARGKLENWKPEVSDILREGHPVHRDINKHLPTSGPRIAGNTTRSCSERINLVYIKEIKCASQTLVNIFRRFGLERRLSFVTPIGKKLYLGWPWMIQEKYYRPSKSGDFNILCDHSVYDEELFGPLMPPDVAYIASLREPFSQFKSMFNYYAFQRIVNISASNPLSEYLNHLDHYESIYVSPQVAKMRYCIPNGFHMSKNLMAYNLGFPTGFLPGKPDKSDDAEFVKEWIASVARRFDVVILVEYFHESLILLKRKLCWNLRDIVYFSQNVGKYSYKSEHNQTLVDIYKKWSSVDYRLYDHFNKTFWAQVSKLDGADFYEEVTHYRRVISDIHVYCDGLAGGKVEGGTYITVHGTPWNKPFDVDAQLCSTLSEDLLYRVQKLWDFSYPQLEQPKPDREFC